MEVSLFAKLDQHLNTIYAISLDIIIVIQIGSMWLSTL